MGTFVVTAVLAVLAVGVVADFLLHPSIQVMIYVAAIILDGLVQALCQGRAK